MSDQTIEARILRLEDIEKIRQLKAQYCAACDADHDGEAAASLFVPGGRWSTTLGTVCDGHDELRAYFGSIRASRRMVHSSHMVTNPVIDVDGDSASASWSFTMMYTAPDASRYRIVGWYRDTCERVNGRWMFRTLHSDVSDYVRLNTTDMLA
jgi:uncharacterized protein (TIGR02246 family)